MTPFSLDAPIDLPSRLNANNRIALDDWNRCNSRPSRIAHNRTVLSLPTVATDLPSGPSAISVIGVSCLRRIRSRSGPVVQIDAVASEFNVTAMSPRVPEKVGVEFPNGSGVNILTRRAIGRRCMAFQASLVSLKAQPVTAYAAIRGTDELTIGCPSMDC